MKIFNSVIGICMLLGIFFPARVAGQCATNIGFENGNLGSWTNTTDSLFVQPANRVYMNPGINSQVVAYGSADLWLGTINRPATTAGNYMVKVGNRGLRAVADTVYRTIIIDSLSDKITIYSMGVSELAHAYWNVPVNESPGFGYEIYLNGRKMDCLKGAFFTGNTDLPHKWDLGTYQDTAGVRRSTGWGKEVLNLSCFVGDTIQIRMFTRDCILLGHYAYAYFDVECGDTTKPPISKITVKDVIQDEELVLYCTTNATIKLEPLVETCPVYMGNIAWTPASYVVGPRNLDSAMINVSDSAWIYAEAEFSNYCMSVKVIDSIFVRYSPFDPHDNMPRIERNFCDCAADSINFNGINVSSIRDQNNNSLSLNSSKRFVTSPCDQYEYSTTWKNLSANASSTNSAIGLSSWVTGNNGGGNTTDSILAGGRIKYNVTLATGKRFFLGINHAQSSHNNDLRHSVYINGTSITAYFGTGATTSTGTYSGTVTIEFEVLPGSDRVKVYINGTQFHYFTATQKALGPVFGDISGQSNFNPMVNSTSFTGPSKTVKEVSRIVNPVPHKYFLSYTDRCGLSMLDTVVYTPNFTASVPAAYTQCGLDPMTLSIQSTSMMDSFRYQGINANGNFVQPPAGAPASSKSLYYAPGMPDYNFKPFKVIFTAYSGRCKSADTINLTVNEIPSAMAGDDVTSNDDSFYLGGSPAGNCATCTSALQYRWSQGNALNDSTAANPVAYKNLIGAPYFVLRVSDTQTGCLSLDTVEIATTLPVHANHIDNRCLAGNESELKWHAIPDKDITAYVVEYSTDGGMSWVSLASADAPVADGSGSPVPYSLTIKKLYNPDVMYRWYALARTGEKMLMTGLFDLSCNDSRNFSVHPNPFTSAFELRYTGSEKVYRQLRVDVINQYGQIVHTGMMDNDEYGLSGIVHLKHLDMLSSGIYQVQVSENGTSLYSCKIFKTQ